MAYFFEAGRFRMNGREPSFERQLPGDGQSPLALEDFLYFGRAGNPQRIDPGHANYAAIVVPTAILAPHLLDVTLPFFVPGNKRLVFPNDNIACTGISTLHGHLQLQPGDRVLYTHMSDSMKPTRVIYSENRRLTTVIHHPGESLDLIFPQGERAESARHLLLGDSPWGYYLSLIRRPPGNAYKRHASRG